MQNPQSISMLAEFTATLNLRTSLTRETVLHVGKQVLGDLFGKFEEMINKCKPLTRTTVIEIAKQVIGSAEGDDSFAKIQMDLNRHCCLNRDMVSHVVKQLLDESLCDKFQNVLNEHQRVSRDMVFEVAKRVLQEKEREKIHEIPAVFTLVQAQSPTSTWTWFTISIQTLIILYLIYVNYFNVDISAYM